MHKRICINEDNGHFYSRRHPDEINHETIAGLVDTYVNGTQVGQILFCVNVRKALFDSKTWEPIFRGYDPEGGDDQPMFRWLLEEQHRLDTPNQGRRQVHNIWLMAQKGLDHFAIWLERCRERGVEGWLTMRMNDVHWAPDGDSHWHSTFWKENPDCRIVTYRDPDVWFDYELDFSKAKVREHYLAFIRELFERYDMDGFELDWMRFGFCLPYGRAKASRKIVTDFLEEVRELSKICSARTGKAVKIGVRVPDSVQTCLSVGYDVVDWIDRGLVQQVTISQFLSDHYLDFPVETWKAVIGKRPVDLAVCLHAGVTDPGTGKMLLDTADVYRGSCGTALVKGADRVYLFNTCYYERDEQHHRDVMLHDILTSCGSPETIAGKRRRHILTFRQFAAPGEADQRKIPVPLMRRKTDLWSRIGKLIPFRFAIGPACTSDETGFLHLGFDRTAVDAQGKEGQQALHGANCWLNGQPCVPTDQSFQLDPVTEEAVVVLSWELPRDSLTSGENLVEYRPPQTEGTIVWAEIDIQS